MFPNKIIFLPTFNLIQVRYKPGTSQCNFTVWSCCSVLEKVSNRRMPHRSIMA